MTGSGSIVFRGKDLYIEYNYTPYDPGRMYMSNGDPGYPPEGGEFELTAVSIDGSDILDLLSEEIQQELIDQYIEEGLEQDDPRDPDDFKDYYDDYNYNEP
jgi:hypothetical protein